MIFETSVRVNPVKAAILAMFVLGPVSRTMERAAHTKAIFANLFARENP
jgi:hypothetical protein